MGGKLQDGPEKIKKNKRNMQNAVNMHEEMNEVKTGGDG